MLLSVGHPAALTQTARPPSVAEWLDARAAREGKAAAKTEAKVADRLTKRPPKNAASSVKAASGTV